MRLHRLTMTAVGPYPGTEVVDFDRFAESGRFLLTGPTGAGKSTIIDAIVFALYGQVADSDASTDRIRSTLADPEQPTEVELIFSTSAGAFRIRRRPGYQRPKKRGSGLTPEKPQVRLWRLSAPDGDPVEEPDTRFDEVGARVLRAVGLRREQFTQTVVLPQGRFAQFLRASSAERHELLRDVFGTQVYDSLQDQIRERSRVLVKRTEEAHQALVARADVLADRLEDPKAEELRGLAGAVEPDASRISGLAAEVLAASKELLAPLDAALGAAEEQRAAARRVLDAAVDLERRLRRRNALLAERAEIAAAAESEAADRERLDAARRAAAVLPLIATAGRALTAARQARDDAAALDAEALLPGEREQLAAQLAALEPSLEPGAGDEANLERCSGELAESAGALATRAEGLSQEAAALTELAGLEVGLEQRRASLAASRDALAKLREQEQAEATALASRPEELATLKASLASAREAQASVPGLEVARDSCADRLASARSAARTAEAIEDAQARLAEAREDAIAALKEVAARRRAWIEDTAGSLAAELVEGEPCPVCGSTEHPAPARPSTGAVTRSQVEGAEASQAAADAVLSRAAARLRELERERASALEASGGAAVEDLEKSLEDAEHALANARRTAGATDGLAGRVDGFTARTEELRSALEARRTTIAREEASLDAEEARIAADASRCAGARGGHDSVSERRDALGADATALRSVAKAASTTVSAAGALTIASADLRSALDSAGFADAAGARDAALEQTERTALADRVVAAQARRARVEHDLTEDPEIATLTGEETADVAGAREVLEAAEERRKEALGAQERARAAHSELARAAGLTTSAAEDLAAVVAGSEALLRVAELVSGRNAVGTPLATWVLLERFGEVLAFANTRLDQMSSGRYELVRVGDESGSAARRDRGLGLGVIDRFSSGGVRDPRTLSGGETFYVSLALALALADVVSAEAGGITMETLFVDEGFGSLDPETLQDVLAELGRLQAGGRTVGIVSHVEELRRQIPDQVRVSSGPGGSTLAVVAS